MNAENSTVVWQCVLHVRVCTCTFTHKMHMYCTCDLGMHNGQMLHATDADDMYQPNTGRI